MLQNNELDTEDAVEYSEGRLQGVSAQAAGAFQHCWWQGQFQSCRSRAALPSLSYACRCDDLHTAPEELGSCVCL